MDDITLLFYIVVVAIGLLSRLFAKKKPEIQDEYQEDNRPQQPTLTFEDLLREFQQKANPPEPKTIEYEPVVKEEEVKYGYETQNYDSNIQDDIASDAIYQSAIRDANVRLNDPNDHPIFKSFDAYEEEKKDSKLVNELKRELSSPESAIKAVIFSEIINRKY